MALDLERPSSVHSPQQPQHSLSLSRSSSPREDRQRELHQGPPEGGVPTPGLKFSIEKILSPDFGRRESTEKRHSKEESSNTAQNENTAPSGDELLLPTFPWLYATRYSARPSSGPRRIRSKHLGKGGSSNSASQDGTDGRESPRMRRIKKEKKKPDEKRPRTAFSAEQLARLKQEFNENKYLTEKRRQDLSRDLKLSESQVKIWFQNRRAKMKKSSGKRNPLALQLMAHGLYNHSTIAVRDDDDDERPKSSSSS